MMIITLVVFLQLPTWGQLPPLWEAEVNLRLLRNRRGRHEFATTLKSRSAETPKINEANNRRFIPSFKIMTINTGK